MQEIQNPHFKYIPMVFIPSMQRHAEATPEEVRRFRRLYNLPMGPLPLESVIYILNVGGTTTYNNDGSILDRGRGGNHYCVVLFHVTLKRVYILGRQIHQAISLHDNWHGWQGSLIWKFICSLFEWVDAQHILGENPRVISQSWRQNGFDCGPIACQVLHHLVEMGLQIENNDVWVIPRLPCAHYTRLKLLQMVHRYLERGMDVYPTFKAAMMEHHEVTQEDLDTWESIYDDLRPQIVGLPAEFIRYSNSIKIGMLKCAKCQPSLDDMTGVPWRVQSPPRDMMEPERLIGVDSAEEETVVRQKTSVGIISDEQWKQATLGRFPRPQPRVHLDKIPWKKVTSHLQDNYDDYIDAPTDILISELCQIPDSWDPSVAYVLNHSFVTPSPWSAFQDYGFRLRPDFFQAFDLRPPWMLEQHILQIGLPNPSETQADSLPCIPTRGSGVPKEIRDCDILSVSQLLQLASDDELEDVLVTGVKMDGKYIVLDILKDNNPPPSLDYSCDIDSLIWVGKRPHFLSAVKIYTTPVIRQVAPIFKSNRVSVKVLIPEPETLQQTPRNFWEEDDYPLSCIPHVRFGELGDGSAELLLFFPRAIHKVPGRGYWANNVPADVQHVFWEHVVLPALQKISPSTREAYIATGLNHAKFRRGKKKGGASTTSVVGVPHINKLLDTMDKIVSVKYHAHFF